MLKLVETVQSVYQAFGRGDVPAILEVMHDDVDWEYVDGGVPWMKPGRGRAAVAQFLQAFATEVELTRFVPKTFMEGPGVVGVVVDLEAIVRRNGRTFQEVDEVHLWQFDDRGRVVRFRHCANTAAQQAAWLDSGK